MNKRGNLALVLAFVVTAGVSVAGIWLLGKVAPGLLSSLTGQPLRGDFTSKYQGNLQLTLLADTFSGYSTFRNTDFQAVLAKADITLRYEDEFDQAKRAERLSQGQADLLVTTLDQFLKQKPKGKIVGLIDRTVGADAVVLNTRKYPSLKSMLDLNQLVQTSRKQGQQLSITFAGDTPSEYLALVLNTKFEAFKLADFHILRVPDAVDAWKLMQDSSKNVPIAVIWEPYVTQARQNGYTVVLSSADAPGVIVDVIVASDRLIGSNPTAITQFLEAYYRRIDANVRDASQFQEQIAKDGGLSKADASAVLQGIEFFTAVEAKSWLTDQTLEKRIGSTAAVLVLTGRMSEVPSRPTDLFTNRFIAKAAQNTQTLVDLVRQDNSALAERLTGKRTAIVPVAPVNASQLASAPDIGNLRIQDTISFAESSADLTEQGKQVLNKLAQEIAEFNPQTVGVRVIGHTSRTGPAELNQTLSEQRAKTAVDYLRSQGMKNNISAEGKGSRQPLSGVAPADSRNQRTEIRLVRLN
jgi:outer membrane protein OmpA-like peptidoglycan-associated protein